MKFTCEKFQLNEAVNLASRTVSTRSTIEVLEGILIEAENNKVTVTGYDLETGISVTIEANILEEGRIVLSAKTLMEIVRKLPEDNTVFFETNEKMITKINCGNAESSLVGMKPEEYPSLPKIEESTKIEIGCEQLKNIIKRTLFAVSVIDSRPILTGVCLSIENDDILGVAIDGYRMGMAREKLLSSAEKPVKFVVPGKSLNEIGKLISSSDEKLTFEISGKHLQVLKDNVKFICRLLEGEFINYESVIPKSYSKTVDVDCGRFTESIERASVIINERMRTPVVIDFSDREIFIECSSSLGKVNDRIDCESEGDNIKISVNNKYMLDALKACDKEKVRIKLLSNISPVVIEPEEGNEFLFIVVPMRV